MWSSLVLPRFLCRVCDKCLQWLTDREETKKQDEITEQEAHTFVEVLLCPLLCNGMPAPTFHDYLSSDTKPGVYTGKAGGEYEVLYLPEDPKCSSNAFHFV